MRVFITGGGGFLGATLVAKFKAEGIECHAPSSSQCNLLSNDSLKSVASGKYDQIIHLAAWTQAGKFCLEHPSEQWVKNQHINTNVLDWWVTEQPQSKLIFMGTSCAYSPEHAHREENYMLGEPTPSLYTYAMTKRMLYQGALAAELQFGLQWLCLVPSTLYGPRYHTDGRQMHFIFDLIRKILKAKHFGENAVLWGDGYQRRELVYVDDFIDALKLLSLTESNSLVNIGGGEDYSIRDFAEIICDVSGTSTNLVKYDETEYVGARNKNLVIEKLLKIMPEFKKNSISRPEGISNVVNWFEENKLYS